MYGLWRPWRDRIAEIRAGLPLEQLQQRNTRWQGYMPQASPITGIEPPVWIFPKRQNEETRPKAGRGRPAPRQPDLDFRLCVAKYVDGPKIRVAYSDGTATGWHWSANALFRPYRTIDRAAINSGIAADFVEESAQLLKSMVDEARLDSKATLATLLDGYPGTSAHVVLHAARSCFFWGLLEPVEASSPQRLYAILDETRKAPSSAANIGIRLSGAGRVWSDCDPSALKEADRRKKMDRKRDIRVTFKGPAHGVQIGDDNRQSNYSQRNAELIDVLKALELLLGDESIWRHPQLWREQRIVEAAVENEDVDTPAVRSAVGRVLDVGGNLALAIVGNTMYDLLKNFAT
ncbi:hypothetical protein Axi01nite_73480 [Actinoplanes xinjiangensis]|nr:hypothetical protein Axi01nite_73480 [Actinoplanes xinjiangensis]